jgi:hypothetical protein
MVNIKSTIRSQDMFGHVIALNFNKQGESHTTLIGGFFSIWIKLAFTVYCYMQFEKLLTNGDPSLVTTKLPLNLEEHGKVNMYETNYHSFIVLKKQTEVNGKCELDKKFYKNLNIRFAERTIDWNQPIGQQVTRKWFTARQCKESDFGSSEAAVKQFALWKGFTLVCPEIPEGEVVNLMGDPGL